MRTFLVAAVVSVAAHAVAVAYAPTHVAPRAKLPVVAAPAPPPPEPELVEVTLLDDAPTGAASGGGGTVAAAGRARMAASTSGGTGPATAETAAPAKTEPKHSPLMTMRQPEIVISGDFMKHFLENSKPLVPRPDVAGEQITADLGHMDARLHDRDRVEEASAETIGNERIARQAKAEQLATVELHPAGNGRYHAEGSHSQTGDKPAWTAVVDRDGNVKLADERNLQLDGVAGIGFVGHFDLSDWAERSRGNDPYASAKLAFLDRTRDARAEIGAQHRTELLKKTPQLLQQHLAQALAIANVAERKQTLFQLWDECAETGNAEMIEAAADARFAIIGFIHAKQISYTPAELVALNAKRQSKISFAP